MTEERYDVAIVGAGIIGTVTAHELVADHDVVVLDRGQVAGSTTGRASGIVSTVASYHTYPDVGAHAMEFFEDFSGTGEFTFNECPRAQLTPPSKEEDTRQRVKESASNGFDTEFLEPDEVEERYPGVFDLSDYVGVANFEDTGWVDPHTFTMALYREAVDAGADFRTGVTVKGVRTENGSVTGVSTDDGTIAADHVVAAAGWRTRDLLADVIEVPVYPFRWQTVTLAPDRELPDGFPMGYDPISQRYWRPEHNGELHIGGGETKVETPGSVRESVTEAFRLETADVMPGRIRGLENARIVSEDTCPTGDATTPDKFPILDAPSDAPDGLIVSTGYHVGGVMTAPPAGAGARALITGEESPFPLEPFSIDRFEDRGDDFEFGRLMADHTSYE